MSYVIAGATSGLLMASIVVAVGPIMLFALARAPSPAFQSMLDRVSPMALMMALVVLAFPTWSVVGAVMGLLYRTSTIEAPGGGLGTPNLVYTLAIVIVALAVVAPLAFLLRRVLAGLAVMTLTFIGVFGWLLPFFAQ